MEDTIAAIATPSGQGAVALLRMSGHKAIDVADKIFRSPRGLVSEAFLTTSTVSASFSPLEGKLLGNRKNRAA